ncbi:MAG: adenosylcobinamide-GDP ribazoletransferase [Cocleimonas sp.]|nr:adenosylcobinamide-GDP ribazoletransferase [Cocleimonas sp.]
MLSRLKLFFIAVTFLTRIPTPKISTMTEKEISFSLLYYPVVGLCIGLLLTLIAFLLSLVANPDVVSVLAAIIIVLWVLITGALHLDGLADTADGFLGGQGSQSRTLEIMKDPVSGPAGISSIFLVLMLKYTAVLSILNSDISFWSLLLAPVLARAVAIGLLTYSPVAQTKGLAFELKKQAFPEFVATILFFVVTVTFFVTNLWVLISLSFIVYAIRHWALSRLGGVTGDILGMTIELIEALFLVMAVLVLA